MSSFFPHTYVQLFGSFSRCTRLVSLKLLGFTSFIRPVLTYTLYELLRHPSPFCCSLSYTLSWSRISLIRISLKQQNSGAEKIWAHQIFKIIHSVGRNVLSFCSLSTVATLKHCWQVMLKSRVPLLSFCFFCFFFHYSWGFESRKKSRPENVLHVICRGNEKKTKGFGFVDRNIEWLPLCRELIFIAFSYRYGCCNKHRGELWETINYVASLNNACTHRGTLQVQCLLSLRRFVMAIPGQKLVFSYDNGARSSASSCGCVWEDVIWQRLAPLPSDAHIKFNRSYRCVHAKFSCSLGRSFVYTYLCCDSTEHLGLTRFPWSKKNILSMLIRKILL